MPLDQTEAPALLVLLAGLICGREAAQEEAKQFAAAIFNDLKSCNLGAENLGVDALDERGREALTALGLKLVDAKPALMEARRCKTADEVACIETAVSIANAGYQSFMSFRAGMRERDGGAAMYKAMMQAGAEVVSGGVRAKLEYLRRLSFRQYRSDRRSR